MRLNTEAMVMLREAEDLHLLNPTSETVNCLSLGADRIAELEKIEAAALNLIAQTGGPDARHRLVMLEPLRRHNDEILERCAKLCEDLHGPLCDVGLECADEIRKLKGKL